VTELITNLIVGAGLGCIYGLIGLSFMGIYNATGVLNFAQGDFVMIGAVIPSLFITSFQMPTALAVVLGLATAVVSALLLQFTLIEPLLRRNTRIIPMAIGTFAFSLVIEGAVGGSSTYGTVPAINYVSSLPFKLGSVIIGREYAIIIATTVVLSAGYWVLLHKTYLGLALRAIGSNPLGAMSIGVREERVRSVAFVISALIAALSGFLVAPLVTAGVTMGFPLLLNGFVAAVVGGMGRAFAPLIGGILLGELVSLIGAYGTSAYSDLASLAVLLLVIMVRPDGLLGTVGRGITDS
jgi:branched-chain amino acid transport system permease protein